MNARQRQVDGFAGVGLTDLDFMFVRGRFHGDCSSTGALRVVISGGDGQGSVFAVQRDPTVGAGGIPIGWTGYRHGRRSTLLGECDAAAREDDAVGNLLFRLVVATARYEYDKKHQ